MLFYYWDVGLNIDVVSVLVIVEGFLFIFL